MHLRLHLRELHSQNFSRRSRRPKLPKRCAVRSTDRRYRAILPLYTISLGPLYHKILHPPLVIIVQGCGGGGGECRPEVGEKIDIDSNFPWSVLLTSLLLSTFKMTLNVQNSSRTTIRIRVSGFMAKFWTFWCPVLWLIIVKIMENCCRFCLWQ